MKSRFGNSFAPKIIQRTIIVQVILVLAKFQYLKFIFYKALA